MDANIVLGPVETNPIRKYLIVGGLLKNRIDTETVKS